ncbi:FAD-dependent oxidoreductase [Herbiconiux ginsengi]|uniref:Succinate dehydrogenase/fumarate reductase, flavoprotein subunit n=1 Tax=Herbiconiux ginsengi TaxID=381665 RepID=A0A1H3TFF3_9MICO|nr:FAD-dependent oxidoreductase [Herbiconiux ginsengi]SDZ49002.1 Succinate dehydrogenase/fumarate reductase, flavoprotein subunit [Herbiconiux ginsengi]
MTQKPSDDSYDVIVLGSGAAGLTAAFTAAHEGATVAVFEKNYRVGGTTAWSGGHMWVPNNNFMGDIGRADSTEEAVTYLMSMSRGIADETLVRAFVEAAPKMADYLSENGGIAFFAVPTPDYHPEHPGGKPTGGRSLGNELFSFDELGEWRDRVEVSPYYSVYYRMDELGIGSAVPKPPSAAELARREVKDERGAGGGLIGALLHACLRSGVHVEVSTPAVDLQIEDGNVVGVVIDSEQGRRTILARRGVVLATGGFEWNEEYRRTFLRGTVHKPASIHTNTGDGLRMAMKAGAALQNMREAWWIPITVLPEGINSMDLDMINADRTRPRSIMINRLGMRYTNEATNYNTIVGAFHQEDVNEFNYANLPTWIIVDQRNIETYGSRGVPYNGTTPDWLIEGATLRELAERLGVPADALEATVARWNANVADGVDPDFHRGESAHDRWWGDPYKKGSIDGTLGPLDTGPYYAMELKPGVIGTKGGPKVDIHARVIGLDDEVIPGLYAVGNASSPTGAGYGGSGGTLGPAMSFGWLAGRHAAQRAER